MPEKPFTVITYAASASLAAAALIYFFNPNYLIDGDTSSTASMRKKGVVGLSNPANDCFINSILQALAGLRELRLYLIRELHRRNLDDGEIYRSLPDKGKDGKPVNERKTLSLQKGEVTQGLKDILDKLNEKPLQKKTISANAFIAVLERAFGTRISKAQQDAQELLQVVAERVSDEYHAGKEARRRAREPSGGDSAPALPPPTIALSPAETNLQPTDEEGSERSTSLNQDVINATKAADEEEGGFPLEGRTESQIECQHCHFVPKTTPTSFVMLTLPVPQKNNATLNECFDSHFKTEYIDDYKCDRCRLTHAVQTYEKELRRAKSEKEQHSIQRKIEKLEAALATDPERPPPDVELPSSKLAPARRIARHVRIVDFPQVLVVHLSRSIFDSHSSSKNTAKVSFPERLPLGGLLHRRNYRLLGVVSHKGTHQSGHYETFRRQHVYAPVSTPHVDREQGPYSHSQTPTASNAPSPQLHPTARASISSAPESSPRSPPSESASSPPTSLSTMPVASSLVSKPAPPYLTTTPAPGHSSQPSDPPASPPRPHSHDASMPNGSASATLSPLRGRAAAASPTTRTRSLVAEGAGKLRAHHRTHRRPEERWWRISDDKIKECRTHDVLGMQKEVYILFYEIERE